MFVAQGIAVPCEAGGRKCDLVTEASDFGKGRSRAAFSVPMTPAGHGKLKLPLLDEFKPVRHANIAIDIDECSISTCWIAAPFAANTRCAPPPAKEYGARAAFS